MSDKLDDDLRRALRAVDPGDDFTQAVMARVASRTVASQTVMSPKVTSLQRAPARPRTFARVLPWAPAAIAASLLVAIVVTHEQHQQEQTIASGLRAREELLEALRVTSQKLDIAYQVVHNESGAAVDSDSGV